MMFDRPTMSAGAVFVDPNVNYFRPVSNRKSLNADNIAPTAWVPNFHFVSPINDRFGWGASITSNYGLATEYADDYAAGSMGGKTDLTTANFNLSGAYRLDSHWSFGLGFDAVYAKAKIERYAGDLGQNRSGSGALPPQLAGRYRKFLPIRKLLTSTVTHGALAGTPVFFMNWIRITATASPIVPK